jgi:hypothetical protein
MSGSLFKYDVGRNPVLWIVLTDGGGYDEEFDYDLEKGWIEDDGEWNSYVWISPDKTLFDREFYSPDLAAKRTGWFKSYSGIYHETFSHNSIFGTAYDWGTRVNLFVGDTLVEMYPVDYYAGTPFFRSHYWFPDRDIHLHGLEQEFTLEAAERIAEKINEVVTENNYRKDLMFVNTHAPETVAYNAHEHADHAITGNAMEAAATILKNVYGFGSVRATYYTIYNQIEPKPGYSLTVTDISAYKAQKEAITKACWGTEYLWTQVGNGTGFTTWVDFPVDAGNYEYVVEVNY